MRAREPPLEAMGDAALYADFSGRSEASSGLLPAIAERLRLGAPAWVCDVVPAIDGIALYFDPLHPELPPDPEPQAASLLAVALRQARGGPSRRVELPVCYEPEFALDLAEVAEVCALAPEEVVRRHSAGEHRVVMIGFAPGQPYLSGLDRKLHAAARRPVPRLRVPTGSVAIANGQTSVYPFETPGGWNVIGRTPVRLFDAARDSPSYFAPGDRVRVVPISRAEFDRWR